jgi:hypothetical protein
VQLDLANVPVSAYEQTLRDLLPPGAHGHEDEPEPDNGGRQPNLVEGDDQAPSTVTEVTFPFLVDDHERPSPDSATQGSSVKSAAT